MDYKTPSWGPANQGGPGKTEKGQEALGERGDQEATLEYNGDVDWVPECRVPSQWKVYKA